MRIIILILFLSTTLLTGCDKHSFDSPRDVVVHLFGAMERDDQSAIIYLVDLPSMMALENEDYALQTDNPRTFHDPQEILEDLTGEGLTKRRWFSMQRVIGQTEQRGDSALVEVSFINKETGIQYYNKFGLCKKKDRWMIYSFRTIKSDKK